MKLLIRMISTTKIIMGYIIRMGPLKPIENKWVNDFVFKHQNPGIMRKGREEKNEWGLKSC